MLPRYKKWYIQKDLCLIHLEFPNTIEALVVYCLSIRPREGSTCGLIYVFLMTPVGISAQESSTGSKMVLLEVSFKFPAAVISVNSHGTQPFIILFRGSGLERLALANVRWLDILDALSWHSYSVDIFLLQCISNTIFNEALEVELG